MRIGNIKLAQLYPQAVSHQSIKPSGLCVLSSCMARNSCHYHKGQELEIQMRCGLTCPSVSWPKCVYGCDFRSLKLGMLGMHTPSLKRLDFLLTLHENIMAASPENISPCSVRPMFLAMASMSLSFSYTFTLWSYFASMCPAIHMATKPHLIIGDGLDLN